MASGRAFGGDGPKLMGVSWTLGTIGLLAVIARYFHARKQANGRWRWDYLWAHLAAKSALLAIVFLTVAASNGLGNDIWKLTYSQIKLAILFTYLALTIGVIAIIFAKLSVIALLMSIESGLARKRRIALIVIAVVFTVANLITIPANWTRCHPVQKVWDPIVKGECDIRFSRYMGMTQSYLSGITDLILALWPISIVIHLESHSLKTRIKIVLLMSAATLPGIFSLLRAKQLQNDGILVNFTRDFSDFMLFGSVELGLIVTLTSIPVLASSFEQRWTSLKRSQDPVTTLDGPPPLPELDMRILEDEGDNSGGRPRSSSVHHESDVEQQTVTVIRLQKGSRESMFDGAGRFLAWARQG